MFPLLRRFPLLRSLRAKGVLAGLVPFALVLAAVTVIGLGAYDRVARNVVTQRDAELATVSAARLGERLAQQTRGLQAVAATDAVRSLEADAIRAELERSGGQLSLFDGGTVVYSWTGVTVGANPSSMEQTAPGSAGESSRLLTAVLATLRPAFSDVFRDPVTDQDVILIGVPIRDFEGEFGGMLAGTMTLRASLLGGTFAEVLELKSGRSGLAYLVDSAGRVIYHRDASQLGIDLSASPPVAMVIEGGTGALIGDDPGGTEVIAGFAPVPGTGWGVVTQERWNLIVGPLRGYGRLLVAMLGVGGLLSAALVFLAIGRALRPIRDLTSGERRIASGDFERPIDTAIDHELRGLAEQFNTMAGALEESYADLEARVEARTEETRSLQLQAERRADEIAAINLRTVTVADVAAKVTSILSLEELLPYVTNLLRDTFGYDTVYIFLREPESDSLVLTAGVGGAQDRVPLGERLKVGEGINGWVAEHGEPVLAADVSEDPRFLPESRRPDTRAQLSVPIAIGDEIVGVLGIEQTAVDAFDETDQFTAQTLAYCLGVAIENTRLFEQAGEVAVLEERNRMAREIHDTLAQGFAGIVLQLEAAEQAHEQAASVHEDSEVQAELQAHLSRAKDLARDSLNEARRSVWGLAPRALDAQPLAGAIEDEVVSFAADGSERASFALSGAPDTLPPPIEAALLRICQESLANVRRHARASEVSVELDFTADAIRLRIGDDGAGFDVAGAQEAAARARGRVRDRRNAAARAAAQRLADGEPKRWPGHARGSDHPDSGRRGDGALESPRVRPPRGGPDGPDQADDRR